MTAKPYVGPRAFEEGEQLFGRDIELREVLDRLIAQRLLLLYSPSGAGKTSLLEAGLRPALKLSHYFVYPTVRIGHDPAASLAGVSGRNRYLMSTILSLDEGRPREHALRREELVSIGLADYLARVAGDADGMEPCLFFDQFEELFTLDATDQPAKAEFLAEVGGALRDRGRWAVFAMREDFVPQLDPYLELLPTSLRTHYRLDLLTDRAAIAAIKEPAARAGVIITDAAARKLVDDLRTVRVQRAAAVTAERGPYVEPVQLQVVCDRLWTRRRPGEATIQLRDVEALGDVDNALADYYAQRVRKVAEETDVSERMIRRWFGDSLISREGFRSQVLDGPGGTSANQVLRQLVDDHLIRADTRRGATWYELTHDRLVEPICQDNRSWLAEHLSNLQKAARVWADSGRPARLLLSGSDLDRGEAWPESIPAIWRTSTGHTSVRREMWLRGSTRRGGGGWSWPAS